MPSALQTLHCKLMQEKVAKFVLFMSIIKLQRSFYDYNYHFQL